MDSQLKSLFMVILFILLVPSRSYSFEGSEHNYLSNIALNIAFEMNEIDCNDEDNYEGSDDRCGLIASVGKRSCEISVEEQFELDDKRSADLKKTRPSYGDFSERIDFVTVPSVLLSGQGEDRTYPKRYEDLNPNVVGRFAKPKQAYLRSSHINDAHFQSILMFEMYDWHNNALRIAEESGNLFSALILNSASDHYLQDFFAPGHISTSRYNLADPFALGLHDFSNAYGAEFNIDNWKNLSAIFERAQKTDIGKLIFDPKTYDSLKKRSSLVLYGDGALETCSEQEMLMLLVEIKSIDEVIQCFKSKGECEETSFAKYSFTSARKDEKEPYGRQAERAKISYGQYDMGYVNGMAFSPVFGITTSHETLYLDEGQSRWANTLELIPFGFPGSHDFLREKQTLKPSKSINWATAFGYTYVDAKNYHASGLSVRSIWAWPMYESAISLYARSLKYELNDSAVSRRKRSYGVRGEIGFGLLQAFMSVGKGYGYSNEGQFDNDLLLSFGLSVYFPTSRVPLLGYIEKQLYRWSGSLKRDLR